MMQPSKYSLLAAVAAMALSTATAHAGSLLLWGNNAGPTNGADVVEAFNPVTGAVVHQYALANGNGRGVVIVGNTGNYTQFTSGTIGEFNVTTGTVLSTSIATSLSGFTSLTFNGTDFYASDAGSDNNVYKIGMNGNIVSTIQLADCAGNCDGLNYYKSNGTGYLISSQGEGQNPATYDVYTTSGTLVTSALISTANVAGTGIAYNPANGDFYVSDIYSNAIQQFSGSGALLGSISLGSPMPSSGSRLIEGLSFDYAQTLGTAPPSVPEPGMLAVIGVGLAGLGMVRRGAPRKR